MFKREITYEDYNGDTVTETFYFHISKPELIELEVEFKEGFSSIIQQIIKSDNKKDLIMYFKKIVLMSYGKKSDDGKRFIKSDEIRDEFSQSAAYESLFMELATNDNAAVTFLKSALPKGLTTEADKASPAV